MSWWNSDWKYRKKLTFANNAYELFGNFPILVHLKDGGGNGTIDVDFDEIKADGADIRFVDDDDATELKYEIEYWDDVGEEAWIWVRVPIIAQSDTDFVYMYWGNAAASDNQNAGQVWGGDRFGNSTASSTLSVARGCAGIAVISDKVYFAGGIASGNVYKDTFEEFDATGDAIVAKHVMPAVMCKPFCGAVGGKVYVIGGCNEATHIGRDQVWEYDPGENDWTVKESTLPVAAGFGVAVVYDSKIYCIAGYDQNAVPKNLKCLQIYDPSGDSWDSGADLPVGYDGSDLNAAVLTVGGKDYIYVLLGYGSGGYDGRLIRYDIEGDSWETGFASYPISYGAGGGGAINNKFLVVGGWDWGASKSTDLVFLYDPATDEWTEQIKIPQTAEGTLYLGVVSSTKAIYGTLYYPTSDKIFVLECGWGNFQNVYHLKSDIVDSTFNSFDLGKTGTVNFVDGKIYKCASADWKTANKLSGTTFNPGTKDFTIGCFFKKDGASAQNYTPTVLAISHPTGNPRACFIATKTDGYAMLQTYDGASSDVTSIKDICDNAFHLAIATRKGTTHKLIVDGVEVGSDVLTARNINTNALEFGQHGDAAYDFIGQAMIDQAFVLNVARSVNWAAAQYKSMTDEYITAGPKEEEEEPPSAKMTLVQMVNI